MVRWRRAWWWASWQAWLFFHPPQDPGRAVQLRWLWGRLGCLLMAMIAQTVLLMAAGIVWAWMCWVLDL